MNSDNSDSYFLDFDVLVASCVLDGEPLPESPDIAFTASDQEVVRVLDDYSRRCERIWRSVGGRSADNFEALAIWLLHNRDAVGSDLHDMGVICAAFVYGERQLGWQIIEELELFWQQTLRMGHPPREDIPFSGERLSLSPEALRNMYEGVQEDLARLRAALGH